MPIERSDSIMVSTAPKLTRDSEVVEVTTADLMALTAGGTPRVVDQLPRVLTAAGVRVARLGADASKINPMCARSAAGIPVIEMLAAIASQDPTGVLIIETADRDDGFAFNVEQGRVVSAKGPGALGQLETWCSSVHQRFPERFETDPDDESTFEPSWVRVPKVFVSERTLDYLELTLRPGIQLTFVRGDVEWIGTSLSTEASVTLSHLLLEHARRTDERPRLLSQLGELDQIVVPISKPATEPTTPSLDTKSSGDDEAEDWDFFDDPDPAAMQEWNDAQALWTLCDGQHSIEEVIEQGMLGRFRGLAAITALASRQHVMITAPSAGAGSGRIELNVSDDDEFEESLADIVELPSAATVPPPPVLRSGPREDTSYQLGRAGRDVVTPPALKKPRARAPARNASISNPPRHTGAPPSPAAAESGARHASTSSSQSSMSGAAKSKGSSASLRLDVASLSSQQLPVAPIVPETSGAELASPTLVTAEPSGTVIAPIAPRGNSFRVVALALVAAALFLAGAGAALSIARSSSGAPASSP